MIISRVMTRNPVFIYQDMTINEVQSIMEKKKVGHLPVLNKDDELIGIMTRKDLLKASPTIATSLDMYEISYLLSKIRVKDVMEKKVVSVNENEIVEEAARIMADNKIGCLPVINGKRLIGIITDTDIFHVFLAAFGARRSGLRIALNIEDKPGQLAKLTRAVADKGGNVSSFVVSELDDRSWCHATLKVADISREDMETILKGFPEMEVEDLR